MGNASSNIWAALRNSAFRRYWFATVISGSCVAAQSTATYWALNALGATTVLISVMATVSALPGALFTLPAGAIADIVDRKKILLTVQIWQASIVFGLAILWAAHLLNPYLILASTFLLSAGFAFSSPASSVAIAEMVSPEELAPAYSWRAPDESVGNCRSVAWRSLASVNRSKFHFRRQRAGFPLDVLRYSPMETGTAPFNSPA